MKQYYLMAVNKGNIDAMHNLGHHNENEEPNDELMKKYYLMAIDKDNDTAKHNLEY